MEKRERLVGMVFGGRWGRWRVEREIVCWWLSEGWSVVESVEQVGDVLKVDATCPKGENLGRNSGAGSRLIISGTPFLLISFESSQQNVHLRTLFITSIRSFSQASEVLLRI